MENAQRPAAMTAGRLLGGKIVPNEPGALPDMSQEH